MKSPSKPTTWEYIYNIYIYMFWFTFSFSILHYNTQIQKKIEHPIWISPIFTWFFPWANVKTKSLRIPSSMFFALLTLNKKNPLAHVTWCIFLDVFLTNPKWVKKNWLPLGSCYISWEIPCESWYIYILYIYYMLVDQGLLNALPILLTLWMLHTSWQFAPGEDTQFHGALIFCDIRWGCFHVCRDSLL